MFLKRIKKKIECTHHPATEVFNGSIYALNFGDFMQSLHDELGDFLQNICYINLHVFRKIIVLSFWYFLFNFLCSGRGIF